MKKGIIGFVFILPLFINNSIVWGINRNKNSLKQHLNDKLEGFYNISNDTSIKIGGDTCKIFSSDEGDKTRCWCPRGYILCNEEDVMDVKNKLSQIKNITERSNATPLWLKSLCDDSELYGFQNISVAIDSELSVICKENANKELADADIIGTSGYIPQEIYEEEKKKNIFYSPRKCTVNSFYLCKPVSNDIVNCTYTPWSEWSECTENKRKRWRKLLRSNQNNNNYCLWKNKIISSDLIVDTEDCL